MTLDDYLSRDGLELADLVRRGEVSPVDLLEVALEQADRVDPVVNALVHRMDDEARRAARSLEERLAADRSSPAAAPPDRKPFLGVPFLVKDLLTPCAGHPHTSGSRLMKGHVADHDAEVVRRYRASGAVIFGKTNTPEFGLVPYTEPELFGATRNPWDPSRTPGGSSGGSAAAVAGGVVPLAGGNDGGGSIRIPASCCGLFGLKPTRGRVPCGPDHGQIWRGFAVDHVLTRSVRDSAAMLDAIAGPDVGAPYVAPPPDRPFLEEVERDPGRLRVALTAEPLLGTRMSDECRRAAERTGTLLEEMGHEVEVTAPDVERETFAEAFLVMVCAEVWADLKDAEAYSGRTASPGTVEPETWALALLGRRLSGGRLSSALRYLERTAREVGAFFEDYDVLVSPTLAWPPPSVGSLQRPPLERLTLRLLGHLRAGWLIELLGGVDRTASDLFEFIPFPPLFNVTGQPAMSVPLARTGQGIPVGVHAAGRFGDEATLFRLAGRLEEARPWFDRLPDWVREEGGP